jgi:hypothetical protein
MDLEAKLCGETHRTQHAHGVLAVTHARIANRAQDARLQIGYSTRVINHREIADIVVQGIDGKIPAPSILLYSAENIIANDAAVF